MKIREKDHVLNMDVTKTNTGLKSGISIDDVYKIRVLDSDTATQTEQLKVQCSDFVESEFSSLKSCSKRIEQH